MYSFLFLGSGCYCCTLHHMALGETLDQMHAISNQYHIQPLWRHSLIQTHAIAVLECKQYVLLTWIVSHFLDFFIIFIMEETFQYMHVPEFIRLLWLIQKFATNITHLANVLGFGVDAQASQVVMGRSVSHEKQNQKQHNK